MDEHNPLATPAFAPQPQRAQKRKRSADSESHSADTNKREHVFITHIRATDVVSGLRRVPAGFYAVIEVDGKTTKTLNKPVLVGKDVVEWDEEIFLPPERSSSISFKVYASFELGPRFGNGELLRQFKVTVEDVLDLNQKLQPTRFLVQRDEVFPSCSSVGIIAERRICDISESTTKLDLPESDAMSQLEQLTDNGHRALLRYRQLQNQADLDEAIMCFERVQDMRPPDHPNRSAVLFNLANAKFIHCQANNHYLDLDVPITLYREVLRLRPSSHPDHCATALDLSFALLVRFQRRGDETDRTEAEDLLCSVVELFPVECYAYRAACLALQMAEIPVTIQAMESGISEADSGNPDDEELIQMARARLLDLSDWNPRRPAVLADLGSLLHRRFEGNGDLVNIDEAISMFEEAAHLSPNDHPDKPAWLNNLGSSLLSRFERLGDLADIDKSISMKEEAVRLTPNGHPDKPGRLNNLGNSLSSRFEHLGDLADINNSISMLEEAVRLTPNGYPDKPTWLNNLGNSLLSRFQRLGDLADMDRSISMFEEAVRLTPTGHPDEPAWLNNFGDSLLSRFERIGDLADISKSISMFEEAVRLTPNGHPDKPAWLSNHGNSLLSRFERLGDLADVDKSISIFEKAVQLTPNGHPDKPARLNNLGNSLFNRFEHLGDLADINKSISMKEEAVRLTPNDHSDKPVRLNNLGNSLLSRFQRLGDLADIINSISMKEEAVRLTPNSHPKKPARLNNLGNSLLSRFQRLGDLADMDKSISVKEEAVRLTPNNHPDKPARLNNLGDSLLTRFEHLGDLTDINKSMSVFEEAVRLTSNGHPDKPARLNNLGVSLSSRFRRLGDLADIDKSILMLEEAMHLTSHDHPDKPGRLNNLGDSFLSRFERLGALTDINKSISMFEEAIHLTPNDHPDKPARLSNFGNSLLSRFQRLGDLADIDKSILMKEEAVCLTPNGHPNRPGRLSHLGNSLLSRFERLGDLADINNSISMQEEAVRLNPNGHPDKPAWLNNLGNSLSSRFQRLSDLADINKSISKFEEAVRLTPNGHPNKAALLNNLGNAFMKCFERSRDTSHLSAATLHFSLASHASTGPTSTRFRAARHWISSARLQGNSQGLLDAYTTAINLLPQLAWLGLPLTERHRVLLEAADVARDAAAAALEAGRPEMAVEWLEQGRSIVWSQFLQLRTPVDELRVEHPDLADEFQEISQELEHASSRDHTTSRGSVNDLVDNARSLEEEVQRHHDIALRREKLLADIRSLPGFDRFLLPNTIKQLAALAQSGPVVYLNASKQRCDALVVMAKLGGVIPIPLPGISYPGVEHVLRLFLKRNSPVISRDDISALIASDDNMASQHFLNVLMGDGMEGSDREGNARIEGFTRDDQFRWILEFLWRNVINPVLEALGFSPPPSGSEKMTRIFWCPTGPFAFLPIHAAGCYGTAGAGAKLSDFAISSYIPSLSALASSAQKDSNGSSSDIRLVAVPQPSNDGQMMLTCVKEEIDYLRILSDRSPFVTLQDSHGTIEDVMQKMKTSDWVHFACHGMQDPKNPLDSGLCLADHRCLKLSDIIRLSLPRGGLAFLSACQTAQGDVNLPEESVHLAAGMLLAGYGGVIATMWSIMDRDAPKVTQKVYEHLFRDSKVPDSTQAAEALHYAVQHLRDSGASFSSWVPFIHVGR